MSNPYFDKINAAIADLWGFSDGEMTDLLLDNFPISTPEARTIVGAYRVAYPNQKVEPMEPYTPDMTASRD